MRFVVPAVPLAPLLLLLALLCDAALAGSDDGRMEIEPLDERVYLHTSYGLLPDYGYYPSNGLVVVQDGQAWIIDTPWPERDTAVLLQWIESRGLTAVASISTHFHDDRSSGIAALNRAGVATYAHRATNALLAQAGRPVAAHTFEGDHFTLLEGRIEVFYPGPGHTRDNVVVWLPQEKLLFGGCLVRELATRSMGNTADGSLEHWPQSLQNILDTYPDIRVVVPGHGAPGDARLIAHTQELARP